MLSLVIFFVLISSGSVLCAAVWNKKYEEILPITCSSIVVLLFLFGVAGILEIGTVFVCLLGVVAHIFSLIWSIKKGEIKKTVQNILTPAFWVFLFGSVLLAFFIGGKMLWRWDEFSHWGDIVKVMTILDDFGTNPESHSWFQSYPPGMSLFQYFLQEIHIWTAGAVFSEWRLYFAYQIFCLSFFMPFLKTIKKESLFRTVAFAFIIFLVPLLFFADFYTSIYIDQVLGILAGTGLAMILWHQNNDGFYSLYIWSICSMLVLAKDAGMLYAVIVGAVYIVDCLIENKKTNRMIWKHILNACITMLAIFVPKLLWNYNIVANGATRAFSGEVDVLQLGAVVLGKDSSYKRTVWNEFYRAIITTTVPIGNTGLELNYLCILLLFVLFIGVLIKAGNKTQRLKLERGKLIITAIVVQFFVYIVGMCVTYMFKFSEYEALNLASFSRYMNIVFLAIWVVIVLSVIILIKEINVSCSKLCVFSLLCLMVVLSPMESVYDYVSKKAVTTSVNGRSTYEELTNKIEKYITSDDRVYFISQESSGFDLCVMRYNSRPHYTEFTGWSIGEPFYEGDVWTQKMTQQEWTEILSENYDYVVLFKINDYFVENFSAAFENAEDIVANCVYKVNKETKLLELCE